MISIETDRFGRTYQIWKQNQMNSCAIASCWMARGIAKQQSFAEEEWEMAVRIFSASVANGVRSWGVDPNGPVSIDPSGQPNDQSSMASTLSNFGLFGMQVAAVMRGEGFQVIHRTDTGVARTVNAHRIAYNKPAILGVRWNGGGGHAVVAGRCTSAHLTILDPWDGRHIVVTNNGQYSPRYGGTGVIREIVYISA